MSYYRGKRATRGRPPTSTNRTERAFIEPMKCKPVVTLRSGEKWRFEIKFDGYRCIAVKRGRELTLFSPHKKVGQQAVPLRWWRYLHRSGDDSFSTENLLP